MLKKFLRDIVNVFKKGEDKSKSPRGKIEYNDTLGIFKTSLLVGVASVASYGLESEYVFEKYGFVSIWILTIILDISNRLIRKNEEKMYEDQESSDGWGDDQKNWSDENSDECHRDCDYNKKRKF